MNSYQRDFRKKQSWTDIHDLEVLGNVKVVLDDLLDQLFDQLEEAEDEKIRKFVKIKTGKKEISTGYIIDTESRFALNMFKNISNFFIVKPMVNGFTQIQVHQQFDKHLSGYHMLYNVYKIIKFYRTGKSIYLKQILTEENKANPSFWKFRHALIKTMKKFSERKLTERERYGVWGNSWKYWGKMTKEHLMMLLVESNLVRSAFMINPSMYFRIRRYIEKNDYDSVFDMYPDLIGNNFIILF